MTARETQVDAHIPKTEVLPAPTFAEPDIVRRFLTWAQCAEPEARVEGVRALARAYLYSGLTASVRTEAALAMTGLLHDPSVSVRRVLAEALCRACEAPRTLILALAADGVEVGAAVLQYSPVLTAADLTDFATTGDSATQTALARRPNLPPSATAALAEIGPYDAVLAIVGNTEINLPTELLGRIFDRFGEDASLREALLERPSLPAALRARIAVAAAKDLAIEASQWMAPSRAERVAREARDQAISSIASSCCPEEGPELTRALRATGALTPALLLRSLLCGERHLFAEAIAELSGLPRSRMAGFILEPRAEGFAALVRRAGLKNGHLPAFRAALAASHTYVGEVGEGLKLSLVQKVIDECEQHNDPALTKVLALLWRFAAEAARVAATGFAREVALSGSRGRLPQILDFSPVNDDWGRAPVPIAHFGTPPVVVPLELSSPPTDPREGGTPRVELPLELVARLDDAA
jgi:uncharacterized protein (DUF2336 family)